MVVVVGVRPRDAAMVSVCGPRGPVLAYWNVRDWLVVLGGCTSDVLTGDLVLNWYVTRAKNVECFHVLWLVG